MTKRETQGPGLEDSAAVDEQVATGGSLCESRLSALGPGLRTGGAEPETWVPSGCEGEGKLGVALESLQGKRDLI